MLLYFGTWDNPVGSVHVVDDCCLQQSSQLGFRLRTNIQEEKSRHTLWKFPGMPAGSLSFLGSEFETLSIP